MFVENNGYISHPKIKSHTIENLEHGTIGKVNSIVIHRTAAGTAESTLNTWLTKKSGAHFLIAKDGTIYQTAGLNKACWHMGLVMSRCRFEDKCSDKDVKIIKDILFGAGSWSKKYGKVFNLEKKKNYPDRYPMNSDSIGIELVGLYFGSGDKGTFEKLTKAQASSFLWLMTELLQKYNLKLDEDVFSHGAVARKKIYEGVGAFETLKELYR